MKSAKETLIIPPASSLDWWKTSDLGECPITLESLSTLPYPPFVISQSYFDGFALASFIVSRGVFQNPLTREELTLQDCQRLEEYLKEYCYNGKDKLVLRGSVRKVSVTEAFALRNSIQVDSRTSSVNHDIEELRNAGTAALVGLFVYGNDRFRNHDVGNNSSEEQSNEVSSLLMNWGFDLSRTVKDTSREGYHGYMVIDDDEANIVASHQSAYQAVQEAFPPLPTQENDNSVKSPSINVSDERFMAHLRSLSLEDHRTQIRLQQELEQARENLLREALNRREERRRRIQQEHTNNFERSKKQQDETLEVQLVRAEIDAWREEQWEKLRIISDRQKQSIESLSKDRTENFGTSTYTITRLGQEKYDTCNLEAEIMATEKRKAKAAAKRRRAKERKKELKAVERERRASDEKHKAMEAQKKASAVKCNACGTGIIDCGFEKYGRRFCSTKCARSAIHGYAT